MKNPRMPILICCACCAGLFAAGIRASALDAPQAAAPAAPSAQSVAGEWDGSLGGQIPLVLHVHADSTGALTATMDSPSQGANDLPGANVKLAGSTLTLDIPVVHGNYSGTVSADGKTLSGTWTQNGNSMPLEFQLTKTAKQVAADEASVKPSTVDGNWKGALSAGGQKLHVVFHFHTVPGGAPGGTIRCSMDSLDQNAMGIPCGDVKLDGQKVGVEATAIHGTYDGKLRADGIHIDGTWSQGTPLELDLTKE